MEKRYDCLVVGAGLAGSVAARELAERGGMRVLLLERRDHVGGNAYDCLDEAGVLVHRYGPHIFHTNNKEVYESMLRTAQEKGIDCFSYDKLAQRVLQPREFWEVK